MEGCGRGMQAWGSYWVISFFILFFLTYIRNKGNKPNTWTKKYKNHMINGNKKKKKKGKERKGKERKGKERKGKERSQAVVAHAFNPSTWEAEAGGFLSSRPAWSTK
jgi:hypothetical protein